MSYITQSPYEELKEKYETLLSERRALYGYIDLLYKYGFNILSDEKPTKKKKPKLEFVGYGEKNVGPYGALKFSRISIDRYGSDTHEVWVRPIVRKK